jgi:hypothetical protein
VALQRRDTFARVPVPDFNGVYRKVSQAHRSQMPKVNTHCPGFR